MKKIINKINTGFTLIEMVVVVAVISILFTASIEMFANMYSLSVRINDDRTVLQDARYALETISRETKNSVKLTPVNNWNDPGTIDLENNQGQTIRFECLNCNVNSFTGRITMDVTNTDGSHQPLKYLTSSTSEVIQFSVSPESTDETSVYPFVGLRIQVRGKTKDRTGQKPIVTLATSITRNPYSDYTYCEIFGCGDAKIYAYRGNFGLALKSNGEVWGIGLSSYLNHGLGATQSSWIKTPGTPFNSKKIISFFAPNNSHSLAVDADGRIWSIGRNVYGQLGLSPASNTTYSTWQDTGVTGFVEVSGTRDASLALKSDGTLWATGGNSYSYENGLVSYSTPWQQFNPSVFGGRKIVKLHTGTSPQQHSMVIAEDGTLWSIGCNTGSCGASPPNAIGCLGIGGTTATKVVSTWSNANSMSLSGKRVVFVSVAGNNSYAIDETGELHSVGDLRGLASVSATANEFKWISTGQTNVKEVYSATNTGVTSVYILKNDGTIWYGSGYGASTSWTQDTNSLVNDASNRVVAFSANDVNRLALRKDGSLVGVGGYFGASWTVQSINLLR